jgi:hypothetical protein
LPLSIARNANSAELARSTHGRSSLEVSTCRMSGVVDPTCLSDSVPRRDGKSRRSCAGRCQGPAVDGPGTDRGRRSSLATTKGSCPPTTRAPPSKV